MTTGGAAWWTGKLRQARVHLRARVSDAERHELEAWLSPRQAAIFDAMTVADRRHGLDVVAALRAGGVEATDALVAGLLHDAGKGQTGFLPRVIHSLGQAYGTWIPASARRLPGLGAPLDRLATHPEASARLAEAAGCSLRTVELIRWQEAPRDPEYGESLRLADEAS
ncbi:MAG: hypothetical protein HY264_05045 [Chloroflexi bacterium]|nr:hypothetical protein [Chloroflexota bacterium]